MAELAIDHMPAHNSLDWPVGFHWLAIVDAEVAMDIAVPDIAVPDIAVPDIAVPDIAVADTAAADTAAAAADTAAADTAAGTVVDAIVAAANRRLGWKLEAASPARLENDVRG